MSKKYSPDKAPTKQEVAPQQPPQIRWTQNAIDYWVPIVFVANISIPLQPRSFRGFYKNERSAIMTYVGMAISNILFGQSNIIANPQTGAVAINPDFSILPYYDKDVTGEYVLVNPEQPELGGDEEESKITTAF